MTVRGQMLEWKRSVAAVCGGRATPGQKKMLGASACLLLGLLTSTAPVFSSAAPFGLGLVAAVGPGLGSLMALLGTWLGYLAVGGFSWGVKYAAAGVLVFSASYLLQDVKVAGKAWFLPLTAAVCGLITGFLNVYDTGSGALQIVPILTEMILAGGSAYFFRIVLTDRHRETEAEEKQYAVSFMILLGVLLMSLSALVLFGVISVGRTLAVLLVMVLASRGGVRGGTAAGAALGVAMDLASGGAPLYTMAYAFAGLLGGVFAGGGRLLFTLGFIAANALAVLWTWQTGRRVGALYEVFVSSVVFLLLPRKTLSRVAGLLQHNAMGSGETGLRRYCAGRVRRMGGAFREMNNIIRRNLEGEKNDNDADAIFDRAADAVCVSCKQKEQCWQVNYMDTLSVMNDATPAMLERGRLLREDLPERFLEGCAHSASFISAVNSELRALMYRRQFRARLSENRAAAYEQYEDMAELLEGISEELGNAVGADHLAERRLLRYLRTVDIEAEVSVFRDRSGRLRAVIEGERVPALMREKDYLERLSSILGVRLCRPNAPDNRHAGRLLLLEAEPLAVSVGLAAVKKHGEPVSGDRGTYFKTEQGVLCVILSDGMGSGEEAAQESRSVVEILENFLRSGVKPETAMRMLNSAMLLQNGDDWGYATVDLACIDLFTGETCFYKYGAAPSYVKNGKVIRRVRGESMAAGVCAGESAEPDVVRMHLHPGSVALIASDGVLAEADDRWLRKILTEEDTGNAKALAKSALKTAMRRFGCVDDMTVLAVCVDARK